MAFYRKQSYDNCIQKVRINLGEELGLEKADEAFVELKELPTLETMQLKEAYEKGQVELMVYFKKVMPLILVDHNFYEDEKKKMSNEDVVSLIFEKLDVTSKVVSEYSDAVFSSQEKGKKGK